jgi:anti-sigma regulatory factor (Ser/Thr protein kinase)
VSPDHPACLAERRPTSVTHSFTASAASVRAARAFTTTSLGELVKTDPEHASDVILVVDELATNAITHANGVRNIWVDIELDPRWTHVAVGDIDPNVHDPDASVTTDPLPESGRGLMICDALSARRWWQHGALSKTAHAVILRTGIELTAADIVALDRLQRPA